MDDFISKRVEDERYWHTYAAGEKSVLHRSLITLSAGAIGLSFTLITTGHGPENGFERLTIILTWICFLLTVVFVHQAFDARSKWAESRIRQITLEEDAESDEADILRVEIEQDRFSKRAARFSRLGQLLFVGGVLMMVLLSISRVLGD